MQTGPAGWKTNVGVGVMVGVAVGVGVDDAVGVEVMLGVIVLVEVGIGVIVALGTDVSNAPPTRFNPFTEQPAANKERTISSNAVLENLD